MALEVTSTARQINCFVDASISPKMIVRPHQTHSVVALLFAVKGSIIPVIWPRVLYTMLLSLIVVLAERHGVAVGFTLNAAPLTLLGLTLAIFLGFRNSVAYQRWWEARTLWGELLIATRNLVRQTCAFMPNLDTDRRRELVYGVIGFTHALRHHLRGSDPEADVMRWLSPVACKTVLAAANRPNAVLGMLGIRYAQAGRDVRLDANLLVEMDSELNQLSHTLGGCERIKGTPIPFAYILLLHRTVHIYCFLLPFCLIGFLGWFTPLAVAIIAYTFFGLDAIGEQIEDPFDMLPNDLPLDAMSRSIEIDLRSLLGESDLPAQLAPQQFVLL